MSRNFNEFRKQMAKNDLSYLPIIHLDTCALKSFITFAVSEGIEECRRSCGGHGYSVFSGLPQMYTMAVHVVTAEGENYVLTQQVARFLLKCLQENNKPLPHDVQFFAKSTTMLQTKSQVRSESDWNDLNVLNFSLERRLVRLLTNLAENLQREVAGGKSPTHAWNNNLIEVTRVSKSYALVLCFHALLETIEKEAKSTKGVLSMLAVLFGTYWIERDIGEFCEDGYLNQSQCSLLREVLKRTMGDVRLQAIHLVDSFHFSDQILNSALGKYDGNVYDELLSLAKQSPLNKNDPVSGWSEFMKPILHSKL